MGYKVKRVSYETINLDRDMLMTVMEVAEMVDMTMPGVIAAIHRGVLTEVIDDAAVNPQKERRLILRSEVGDFLEDRRERGLISPETPTL